METIINAPEFFRDGNAYFIGVWDQAKETPDQLEILRCLSQTPLTLSELASQTNQSAE